MRQRFNVFTAWITHAVGTPGALVGAVAVIIVWAVTGPLFGFSDSWQLVINTGTTSVTFLMVFAIQNTQNRDAKAVHIKLDELLRAVHGARTYLALAETESDEEQDRQIAQLVALAQHGELPKDRSKRPRRHGQQAEHGCPRRSRWRVRFNGLGDSDRGAVRWATGDGRPLRFVRRPAGDGRGVRIPTGPLRRLDR